jgi:hypothetical protein
MLNDKTKKNKNLKNKKTTNLLNHVNLPCRDPWDPKPELNQKTQFSTNLILNDKIKNKINLKKLLKLKKHSRELESKLI